MKFCKKLVYGAGINDYSGKVSINGKIIKSYYCWKEMLRRCYSKDFLCSHPTYYGCTVCDEWLKFSNFKEFFDNNYVIGYQLDKDIIVRGNKIYAPNLCRFIPSQINSLIENSKKIRGSYPVGVNYDSTKGLYRASCSINNKTKNLGNYSSLETAFEVYKQFKQNIIKETAEKYYRENMIDFEIYSSLIRWNISFND